MTSQGPAGHGIEDLYRSVMNDVITQVKEAFLDENIDVDVLEQLKKMWEDKVNQSGAVDLTPKAIPAPTMRQPIRQNLNVSRPGMVMSQPGPSGAPIMIQRPSATHQVYQQQVTQVFPGQSQVQFVQGTTISTPGQVLPSAVQLPGGNIRVIQNFSQPGFMQGTSSGLPHNFVVLPGGQLAMQVSGNVIQAPTRPQMQAPTKSEPGMNYINQLDGASRFPDQGSSSGSENSRAQAKKPTKSLETKKKAKKIPQLDGGPGMTDSSSEDDLEDEEDDPLRRIADRIGNDGNAIDDDEQQVEEASLNSEDDQSDDEDLETLFDSNNVVVCQFEKVHRARNKWKFALKDGIMNIRGKDYCFQKCTGEAEW